MLIGISGKATAGKDTVAGMLQKLNPKFENKKLGYKLKKFIADMMDVPYEVMETAEFKNGFLEEWGMTGRDCQIDVGDGLRNVWHPDCWIKGLMAPYTPEKEWMVTDVRYPNEKSFFEKIGVVIRVINPRIKLIDHYSETALDNEVFRYVIINDGTLEELFEKVKIVYEQILRDLAAAKSN